MIFPFFFLVLLDCRTSLPKSCTVRIVEQQLENGSTAQTYILSSQPPQPSQKKKKPIMIDQSQLHNPSLTSPCLTSPPKFPHSQLPVTLRPPQTTKLTHPPTHLISSDGFQPPHQPTNQPTKTIKKTTYYILPLWISQVSLTSLTQVSALNVSLKHTHTPTLSPSSPTRPLRK